MRFRWVAVVMMVGGLVIACSSSSSVPSGNGNGSGGGVGQPVTQTIGTSGGTVSTQGVVLTIPAGALPGDTQITITPTTDPIPDGYAGLSPLFKFGPDGTVFQTPATVDFALANKGTTPTVFWSNSSGGYDALATSATSDGVSAPVMHFSSGFVADIALGRPVDAGSTSDSGGPLGDGGTVTGIVATIAGTVTTFATNPLVTLGTGTTVIQADDSAATTHWRIQIVSTGTPSETCLMNGNPYINYLHMIGPQQDKFYTSKYAGGSCSIDVTSNPAASGDHAIGTFSGTMEKSLGLTTDPVSYDFASGGFDVVYAGPDAGVP